MGSSRLKAKAMCGSGCVMVSHLLVSGCVVLCGTVKNVSKHCSVAEQSVEIRMLRKCVLWQPVHPEHLIVGLEDDITFHSGSVQFILDNSSHFESHSAWSPEPRPASSVCVARAPP